MSVDGGDVGRHDHEEEEPLISPDDDLAQSGVQRIEAVSISWTKLSLGIAYAGLYLMTFVTSLEGQTTSNLVPFATSWFGRHSLVSTIGVIQGVVNAVIKPPISKVADVFGRLEAFCFSIFILVLGYILQASSPNIQTFAGAQVLYAAGSQGLQVLQQIFIADTSNLLNRALYSTIPDLPFLVTVWCGPLIAQTLADRWRWGYGLWAVILPMAFLPLASSLLLNSRKAAKAGILAPSPVEGKKARLVARSLWVELDFFGLLLLSAAISLILIPLTLAARAKSGWTSPSIIVLISLGGICLLALPFWESSKRWAPSPFFPRALLKKRTFLAGITLAFFYFMAYYLSVYPYFTSYLLVVHGKSLEAAGHIVQTFTFASTVTSIIISFIMKYTGYYKHFVVFGAMVYIMGLALMLQYRTAGVSTAVLVLCQVPIGVGGSLIHLPAQIGVQTSANHQEIAAATAIFLTLLELGGAVGAAISGAVWSSNLPHKLAEYLPAGSKDQAQLIYSDVKVASTKWAFGTPERTAINRAYQETMHILLIIAICVALPLLPLSLTMKNYRLDKVEDSVKGVVIGSESTPLEPNAADEDMTVERVLTVGPGISGRVGIDNHER